MSNTVRFTSEYGISQPLRASASEILMLDALWLKQNMIIQAGFSAFSFQSDTDMKEINAIMFKLYLGS